MFLDLGLQEPKEEPSPSPEGTGSLPVELTPEEAIPGAPWPEKKGAAGFGRSKLVGCFENLKHNFDFPSYNWDDVENLITMFF